MNETTGHPMYGHILPRTAPTWCDYPGRMTQASASKPLAPAATPSPDDVLELLGLVAHIESNAFLRTAAAAIGAAASDQRLELSRISGLALARQERILDRMVELGLDTERAARVMFGFDATFDDYNARTEPSDVWEAILKEYVGHGVGDDFCRVISGGLDDRTHVVLTEVLDGGVTSDSAIDLLAAATSADAVLSSRLALWGRRLAGEALSVVQRLLHEHPALARMVDAAYDAEFAEIPGDEVPERGSWLFSRLTAEHTRRMSRLGLAA